MTKKLDRINAAYREAQRFIRRCDTLFECLHKYEEGIDKAQNHYLYFGSKESGAVRRASMDLTRALAEMRKP